MTRVRKACLAALALLCAAALGVALASCGGKETTLTYGYGEEGSYYRSESSGEDLLTLRAGTYILTLGTAGYAGTYEWTEGGMTFYEGDEETGTGVLTDGGISLTWGGRTYLFLTYEYHTVSFVFGNETLATQSVLNGKAATDPGDAVKDGYVFLGWYTDSSYTERYEFNTSITSDTIVYARFVELTGATEYKITYDFGNGETEEAETLNGKIYDLPAPERSGYTFIGWWVSATDNADELTYRYDGEELFEDTTLFAVYAENGASYIGASVKDGTLTWLNAPAGTLSVYVADGYGNITFYSVSATSASLSLAATAETGMYTVTVSAGGVTEELTYVRNGLSRVSGFTVLSGSVLMYGEVAGAEGYYISIDCGTEGHDHSLIDNGTSLYYDFSSCEMPAEGITFTVYAYAEDCYYSVSSYNYFLGLDRAVVTVRDGTAVWDRVDHAMEYEVYINGELVAIVSDTSFSLAEYGTGTYEIAVRPVMQGYWSETGDACTYTKTTLAAPRIVGIEDYVVSWTEVEGAKGYIVRIGGTSSYVEGGSVTSLALSDDNYVAGLDLYEVAVKAVAEDSANDSPYGEAVTVTGNSVGSAVSYNDGTVTWQYSLSAAEYRITVNDGDETIVTGTNSSPVTLTKSGNNEITICFVNDEGDIYGTASITVYAYAIVFDARGGTAVLGGEPVDTIYVAKGDTITLPDAEYTVGAADFIGWYTLPDLTNDPDATEYQGDGYLFEDGTIFNGNSTIVLYACWLNPRLRITLSTGRGTLTDERGETIEYAEIVLNGKNYTVAVPVTDDAAYAFVGWYSEPNGAGTRYTDETGKALRAFSNTNVTTLYAYWAEVLSFEATTYDREEVAAVSKGDGIDFVSEITVPETYEIGGTEYVVAVMNATAFNGCSSLEILNVPDTMRYIACVNNGYSSGNGAFYSCSAITAVNVYATGEPSTTKEVTYYSDDGVLYYKNGLTDQIELYYFPFAKTGSYEIPAYVSNETELEFVGGSLDTRVAEHPVTYIGERVMYASSSSSARKIEEITIPYTVTYIGESAFYGSVNLTEVRFTEPAGGETAAGLTIASGAFQRCTALTEITLPSYLVATDDTFIGETATGIFEGCSTLVKVHVADGHPTYYDIDGVVCSGSAAVYCPKGVAGEYTIPSGITTVGASSFRSCTLITRLVVPGYVTYIGESAFRGCTGLTEIEFLGDDDSNRMTIASQAFYGCTYLEEVTLPSNLTVLEAYAFGGCTRLVTVYFDSYAGAVSESLDFATDAFGSTASTTAYTVKVLYLGANVPEMEFTAVFGKALTDVNIDPGNPYYSTLDGIVFNKDYTSLLYYPIDREGDYVIPDTVVTIGASVFNARTKLTGVYIPSSVRYIGYSAFYGCTGLLYVTFELTGGTSLEIGDYAFYNCSKLTSIELPSWVTAMGEYDDNGNLISMAVFESCSKLEEIIMDENDFFYTSQGILYSKEDGKAVELLFCPKYNAVVDVVIPSSVRKIWDRAFYQNYTVESVSFEDDRIDGDLEFGSQAFQGATSLATITLPVGLKNIPESCFSVCYSLETILIPYTVTDIGNQAFYGCSGLRSVIFQDVPEGMREEDYPLAFGGSSSYGVFYLCTSLEEIVLPDRTTRIASLTSSGAENTYNYMFYGCTSLKSVTIGKNITELKARMFYNCTSLTDVTFSGGDDNALESIGSYAFEGSGLKEITFPANLVSIGSYAFEGTQIGRVTFNEKLETIGSYAFMNTDLKELYITGSITTIDYGAFANCYDLAKIEFEQDVPEDHTLVLTASVFSRAAIESIEIPRYVTAINNSAFSSCENLTDVRFASDGRLASLGQYAFDGCTALEYIGLPASIETLGNYVFSGCSSLREVEFLVDETTGWSSLASLGNYVFTGLPITYFEFPEVETGKTITLGSRLFSNCKNLTTIKLSNGITDLGDALDRCYTIRHVIVSDTNENFRADDTYPILYNSQRTEIALVFGEIEGEFYIPDGVEVLTTSAFTWQSSMTSVSIPASVTEIGDKAFYCCENLESVTFRSDENLTEPMTIGTSAFGYCSSLEVIEIPYRVTTLGQAAFHYCSSLESVTFEELPFGASAASYPLTLIKGSSAYIGMFVGCTSLRSVVLPERTSSSSDTTYLFNGCFALEYAYIPDSVTSYGNYTFANCKSLMEVTIGSKVTSLGNYCFNGCTSLKSVEIPASVTSIGTHMFDGCTALESVTFAEGFSGTSFGNYMFDGCTSLRTLEIPETITNLGTYSFEYSGIEEITIPESVTYLGTSATAGSATGSAYQFTGCGNLKKVVLPSGLKSISGHVFEGCTSLYIVTYTGDPDYDPSLDLTEYAETGYFALPEASSSTPLIVGTYSFSGTGLISAHLHNATSSTYAGSYIFGYCTSLTDFYIDDRATYVGANMLYGCTGLESVTVPENVSSMGTTPFKGMTGLTSLTFETTSLTTLSQYMCQDCTSLREITIPEGVKYLGSSGSSQPSATAANYTFDGCTSLEKIVLPSTLTTVSGYSLSNCPSLKVVTYTGDTGYDPEEDYSETGYFALPSGVTRIGTYAFADSGLVQASVPALASTTTNTGSYIFSGCVNLRSFEFAADSTYVGVGMFQGCTSLRAVELPGSLTTIGANAFEGSGLIGVEIPASVTTINSQAFYGCASLVEFTVASGNANFTALDGMLVSSDGEVICCPSAMAGEVTISSDLAIGQYAFWGCPGLVLTLGDGFTDVGTYTFYGFAGTLVLPDGLVSIGDYAFYGASMTEIVLPEGLETIGSYAFAYSAIETIEIPYTVTSIGQAAFMGCASLVSVTFEDVPEGADGSAYALTFGAGSVTVSNAEVTAYYGVFADCAALGSVEIPSRAGSLTAAMFFGCASLESFVIPENVTELPDYVFYGSGIKEIEIPYRVTSVGNGAFMRSALEAVTFDDVPEGEDEADYALTFADGEGKVSSGEITNHDGIFDGCESLTSFVFPSRTVSYGVSMFYGCTSLRSVTLAEGVDTIPNYMFTYSGLDSIFIPYTVVSIGQYVFTGSDIREVVFEDLPDGVDADDYEMSVGSGTVNISLDAGVASVTTYISLFSDCVRLESINLPERMTTIPTGCFYGCTSLKTLHIPSTVTSMGSYIIGGWGADQKVYLDGAPYEIIHLWGSTSTSYGNTGEVWKIYSDATVVYYRELPGTAEEAASLADIGVTYWYYGENGEIVEWKVSDIR